MIFIHSSSRVSGLLLAEMLGVDHFISNGKKMNIEEEEGIHINYGCHCSVLPEWSNIGNTLNYNIRSSNKQEVFGILRENDIKVPEIISLRKGDRAPFDLLGRTDGLSEGRGISYIKEGRRIKKEKDFYTKVEKIEVEYRVHVFYAPWENEGEGRSYIIAASEKYHKFFPFREGFSREHINSIRSYRNGWRFKRVFYEYLDQDIKNTSLRTLKLMEMNFGAIDIGKKINGDIIVFEVNSAPGIEGSILRRYMELLKRKMSCSTLIQK